MNKNKIIRISMVDVSKDDETFRYLPVTSRIPLKDNIVEFKEVNELWIVINARWIYQENGIVVKIRMEKLQPKLMEFKGTKGEWKVIGDLDNLEVITNDSFNRHRVAKVVCYETEIPRYEKHQENAKLIAAAPELLKCVDLVYKSFGGGNVVTFSEIDIEMFKKAIEKALK